MKKTLFRNALVLLALTITACGGGNDNSSSANPASSSIPDTSSESSEPPIVDNSGFKNINEDDEFEIHTQLQKDFLEYDGQFAKCPTDLYPDGTQNLSDSNPITLTWNYELPEGKEVSKYSVIFGQNKFQKQKSITNKFLSIRQNKNKIMITKIFLL